MKVHWTISGQDMFLVYFSRYCRVLYRQTVSSMCSSPTNRSEPLAVAYVCGLFYVFMSHSFRHLRVHVILFDFSTKSYNAKIFLTREYLIRMYVCIRHSCFNFMGKTPIFIRRRRNRLIRKRLSLAVLAAHLSISCHWTAQ